MMAIIVSPSFGSTIVTLKTNLCVARSLDYFVCIHLGKSGAIAER